MASETPKVKKHKRSRNTKGQETPCKVTETPKVKKQAILRIVNGHNKEMCLFAQGINYKDKAQLLQVSQLMCKGTKFNPQKVCQIILDGMQPLLPEIEVPLQANQGQLAVLRKHAKDHRCKLLGY